MILARREYDDGEEQKEGREVGREKKLEFDNERRSRST